MRYTFKIILILICILPALSVGSGYTGIAASPSVSKSKQGPALIDPASIFSPPERKELLSLINNLYHRTGEKIIIIAAISTAPVGMDEFCLRMSANAGFDDGVLIAVVPGNRNRERVCIHAGEELNPAVDRFYLERQAAGRAESLLDDNTPGHSAMYAAVASSGALAAAHGMTLDNVMGTSAAGAGTGRHLFRKRTTVVLLFSFSAICLAAIFLIRYGKDLAAQMGSGHGLFSAHASNGTKFDGFGGGGGPFGTRASQYK